LRSFRSAELRLSIILPKSKTISILIIKCKYLIDYIEIKKRADDEYGFGNKKGTRRCLIWNAETL
jgi:hypothetical protein